MPQAQLYLFFIVFAGLIGCQSPTTKQPLPEPVRSESYGIQLNNNTVWQANEATTTGVHNMAKMLEDFNDLDDGSAFEKLNKQLEDEMILIFTKCNMKGVAHDQLHNFLLPAYEMIEQLKTGDIPSRQAAYQKLRIQLSVYPLYFK